MKESRLGVKMYEEDDPLGCGDVQQSLGIALNQLRVEINKIAELLDDMQDQIDALK